MADTPAPITPDAIAAFRETAAKYGISADAVNKTLGAHGVAEQAPPSGPATQGVITPMAESLNAAKHPTLNDREREQAAATLSKYWTGDAQVLRDALDRAGVAKQDADPSDKRTDMEREFDRTLGGVSPEQYDLNGVYVGRAVENLPERDGMLRGALAAMEVPAALGRGIAEAFLDAGARGWSTLRSDAARQIYHGEQRAIAIRATGAFSWDDLISTAKVAVQRIPRDTAAMLAEQGAFEDGRVLALLFRQGERLTVRQGLKDRK